MNIPGTGLLSFLTFYLCITYGQSPTWQWAHGLGSTGSDVSLGCSVDGGGDVFFTGWYSSAFLSFGSHNVLNSGPGGTSDAFLVKYNAAGTAQWAKTIGGSGGEIGKSVATDASGNCVMTGWFNSSSLTIGSFTLMNAGGGNPDAFLLKSDPSGNILWAKNLGTDGTELGWGVCVDPGGNIGLAGSYSGSLIIGTTSLTNAGGTDVFIVKYDSNGNLLWATKAGGPGYEEAFSICSDPAGNFYVTGTYTGAVISFGSYTLSNVMPGKKDVFIACFNPQGVVQWAKSFGSSEEDQGMYVTTNASGNIFLTGLFTSASVSFGSYSLTNTSPGNPDIFLISINSSGNVNWAKKVGGTDIEVPGGITTDAYGGVYLTGFFNSASLNVPGITNSGPGYFDSFVMKFESSSGNFMWFIKTDGGFDEVVYAIDINSSTHQLFIGGTYNSAPAILGSFQLNKWCGDDLLLACMSVPTSHSSSAVNASLSLFPNPSKSFSPLFYRFDESSFREGVLRIYNIDGKEVYNTRIEKPSGKIYLPLDRGIYIVQWNESGSFFRTVLSLTE